MKILRDQQLAEDVLQEVFLSLWHRAASFDARKGSLLGWLMILCRNRSIDKLRSRAAAQKRSSPMNDAVLQVPGDDAQAASEFPLLQQEIRRALAALPHEQSLPIELAFFQGLSQTEIAQRLDWPLGTVKTRIRLGMQKLRVMMAQK